MVAYQQKHRDCAGTGCRWCNDGYIVGNGEAGALRGQLHDVQGLMGRATIVPDEAVHHAPKRIKMRESVVSPEAA